MVRRKVTYQTLRRCFDGPAEWRKAVLSDIPPSIASAAWLIGSTVIALEIAQVLVVNDLSSGSLRLRRLRFN
jgi:hypothetical protein